MKTLLIDAGNTRVKWAIVKENAWLSAGALGHNVLSDQLSRTLHAHPDTARVIGSNVAGDRLARQVETLLEPFGLTSEWLKAESLRAGVHNTYEQPHRLGADRWAALIGARTMHKGPCLVVCAGTATTIDTLNREGIFMGGMILPGEILMQRSLARDTAQLELANGQCMNHPQNTADAITSGCRLAQVGAIELAFRHLSVEADACCLLSGGAAADIAPLLQIPVRQIDNLVLRGLAALTTERTDEALR